MLRRRLASPSRAVERPVFQVSEQDHHDKRTVVWRLSATKDASVTAHLNKIALLIGLVLMVAPWIRHSSRRWYLSQQQDALEEKLLEQKNLASRLKRQMEALTSARDEYKQLEQNNNVLLGELKAHGDHINVNSAVFQNHEEQEELYLDRITDIEDEIQRGSERKLQRQHGGTAPVHVRVTLSQDILVDDRPLGSTFIMETAPLDVMPVSIELFLRLVEEGFYDGMTLLHKNGEGSTLLHSVPMNSVTGQFIKKPLINKTVLTEEKYERELSFAERSDDYPVLKYSVLFSDKGPHFYINMGYGHRSSGQNSAMARESCFARVVEGKEILDAMMNQHAAKLDMFGIENIRIETRAERPTRTGVWSKTVEAARRQKAPVAEQQESL